MSKITLKWLKWRRVPTSSCLMMVTLKNTSHSMSSPPISKEQRWTVSLTCKVMSRMSFFTSLGWTQTIRSSALPPPNRQRARSSTGTASSAIRFASIQINFSRWWRCRIGGRQCAPRIVRQIHWVTFLIVGIWLIHFRSVYQRTAFRVIHLARSGCRTHLSIWYIRDWTTTLKTRHLTYSNQSMSVWGVSTI